LGRILKNSAVEVRQQKMKNAGKWNIAN